MGKSRGAGVDILALLVLGARTVAALAEDRGADYWPTYDTLRRLLSKGLVKREGAQPHGHTYSITFRGRKELNGRAAEGVRGRLPPSTCGRHGHTLTKLSNPNPKQRRRIRAEVHGRDGWTCHYCGEPGDTVDHIVPRFLGGPYDPSNLVTCCKPCNTAKGLLSYDDFLTVRASMVPDKDQTGHGSTDREDEV